jgi:tetratricopeptide (TPR) repeat protein
MDSDDTIDAANGRKLRELAYRAADPSLLGYVMQVHCPAKPGTDPTDFTAVDHVKLFRNLPYLRFEGRIHEQILGAISRAGGRVAATDLFVVHSGYDHSPEGQKRKLERDLRILHRELEEQPDHPFTLFNLGMTYADCGRFEEAINYLRRSAERSRERDSHLRKVYALLVYCHSQTGQPEAAWEACRRGLLLFPKDAELLFRKGLLLHEAGRLEEAAQAYRHLLTTDEESHFKSVVWGLRGFKGRQNLALVYQDLGQWDRAEAEWRRVTEEVPRYRPGWRGLGEVLLRQGKVNEVRALADRLSGDNGLAGESRVLRAKVAAAQGNLPEAWQEVESAAREVPGDLEPLQALCQFLFEGGHLAEAERALKELVRRAPEDGSAHHNLGMVHQRRGQFDLAVASYRQALRFRPDYPATHVHLANALRHISPSSPCPA